MALFQKHEPIAKLLAPAESMILAPFIRASEAGPSCRDENMLDEQASRGNNKERQKGDYEGAMSFAIGSHS